ncbi:acetyl-CoA/propionyl-CoA carboxylase, biotin carboxylase, biotin carboxyl carrier protein, partial [Actinacidiphila yanglinensis]
FDNTIPPFTGTTPDEEETGSRETVVVEVGGKRLEVSLPTKLSTVLARGLAAQQARPRRRGPGRRTATAVSGDTLASPMQGTIVKVAVEEKQTVAEGDLIVVLEAMKMEQPIHAHRAGTVIGLTADVGSSISSGAVICEIKD